MVIDMVVRLFMKDDCICLDHVIEFRVMRTGYLIDRIIDGYRVKTFEDKRKWTSVELSDNDIYNEVKIY